MNHTHQPLAPARQGESQGPPPPAPGPPPTSGLHTLPGRCPPQTPDLHLSTCPSREVWGLSQGRTELCLPAPALLPGSSQPRPMAPGPCNCAHQEPGSRASLLQPDTRGGEWGGTSPPPPFQDLTAHTLAQATSLSPQPQLVLCTPYCQEAEGPRGGGSGVPSGRTCSLCPPPSPPPPALRVQLSLCEPGPPSTGHSAPCSSLHYSVPPRRVCFAVLPQPLGRWRAHSGAQLPGPFPGLFTPDTDARIRVSSPQPGPASPRPGDSNG